MTGRELDKRAAHHLAVICHAQEVTGNVSRTCRYCGITRQAYYKWRRRCEAGRDHRFARRLVESLHEPAGDQRRDVVGKVVYLRQTYHFGRTHRIAMFLKRYHDLELRPSGIWRILKRLDMSRLPASQRFRRHRDRWERYKKPQPGHRVQIDVKFIAPLPGSRHKYYQFTAIDDCTRIRALRVYDRCNQPRRSDSSTRSWRGCPSRSRRSRRTKEPSSSQGSTTTCSTGAIGHVYIRPATPRLNGKVERSHRIDADEFYRLLEGVVMDDNGLFKDRLREWENFFNVDRPHGGLGGQTPYERLRQKTGAPV